ncbi:MAG TPA: aldehyde dehydrogenase family protein, partial [Gemmatimonadaceae bacterium]
MTVGSILKLQNFVGNSFRAAASDGWIEDLNPSDVRDVIALIPEGTPEDARAATAAAAAAFPAWRALTGPARAEHLHRWAAAISGRAEELSQVMAREVGKPIGEARGEVGR